MTNRLPRDLKNDSSVIYNSGNRYVCRIGGAEHEAYEKECAEKLVELIGTNVVAAQEQGKFNHTSQAAAIWLLAQEVAICDTIAKLIMQSHDDEFDANTLDWGGMRTELHALLQRFLTDNMRHFHQGN